MLCRVHAADVVLWCCMCSENEVDIALAVRPGANVVQVYGFCFDAPDGKVRIVMELCTHGSLRMHLKALPRDKVRTHPTRRFLHFAPFCSHLRSVAPCCCHTPTAHAVVRAEHLRSTDQRREALARVPRLAPGPADGQRAGGGTDPAGGQVG